MQRRATHTSPVQFRREDWSGLEKDRISSRIPVHLVAMETRCGVSTYPSAAVCSCTRLSACQSLSSRSSLCILMNPSVSDVVQSVCLTVHLFTHLSVCLCELELRSFHALIDTATPRGDEALHSRKSRWKFSEKEK